MELKQEILAIGKWNGYEFTLDQLRGIKAAFDALVGAHKVPLKLGHNAEQDMTDGQPALGWVTALDVINDKLVATMTDVPEIVSAAINKKLYRNVSVELDRAVSHKGASYEWVLSGLALLGADIPAVNTLNDLGAYMSRDDGSMTRQERVSFTVAKGNIPDKPKGEIPMTAEEAAKMKALEDQNAKLIADGVQLSAKVIERDAQDKVRLEAEATAKFTADKTVFSTEMETMVKDGRLTPAQRDALLVECGTAPGLIVAKAKAEFAAKAPGKKPKSEEAAKGDGEKEEGTADVILMNRTNKLLAQHPTMTFSAAKHSVMRGDPELARQYIKLTG